jgi:hypothetical protein
MQNLGSNFSPLYSSIYFKPWNSALFGSLVHVMLARNAGNQYNPVFLKTKHELKAL